MTYDDYLSDKQNKVKWKIVNKIIDSGFKPHIFFPVVPDDYRDKVTNQIPWGADKVEEALRKCVGAVMLGYPRWSLLEDKRILHLASDYTHYEAGVARTLELPMFMALEEGIEWRGAFDGHENHICKIPLEAEPEWLDSPVFVQPFDNWLGKVKYRKDVFLGYSSEAAGPAGNIKRLLESFGASVLDWQEFDPGTILEQIEVAASRCNGGVFLFTKTDKLEGSTGKAAPRDNVVFEAGYFTNAKGHKRVLIVLEGGAKMPADLGGAIYAPLGDRADVESIKDQLERFVVKLYS